MDNVTGEEFDKMFGGMSREVLRKAFGNDLDKITMDDFINFARIKMKENETKEGMTILADVTRGQLVLVFPERVDCISIDAVDLPLLMPMFTGTAKWLIDRLMQIHVASLDPEIFSDFMVMLKIQRMIKEEEKRNAEDGPQDSDPE